MDDHSENGASIPTVSILLPNLNNRPFLEERIQTILDQTLTDWELIVVDNYSDDGAWAYFQECALRDPRIRISQAPREGMYANWNNCVRLARGSYIYIATSDDTMTPDCLEKMVGAMEKHPECDLCHCCLTMIDEFGNQDNDWWLSLFPQRFYGGLTFRPHVRLAPLDGLLHARLNTIYHSITQLLIRRTLFDRIGLFRTCWGSRGDFEWEMRASLVCNTLHIPEQLATWRRHTMQATVPMTGPVYQDLSEMVRSAVDFHINGGERFCKTLDAQAMARFYQDLATSSAGGKQAGSARSRIASLCRRMGRIWQRPRPLDLGGAAFGDPTDPRSAQALGLLKECDIALDRQIVLLDAY